MRWTPGGRSANLDDLRGQRAGGGFGFGGIPRLGIGGFLVLLVLSFIFKQNLFSLLGGSEVSSPPAQNQPVPTTPEEENQIKFVSFVLDDVQKTWQQEFSRDGQTYQPARLGIFTDSVRSGCGNASSAMGPFYCPVDQRVYIDLGFYDELQRRFGAPGDFAQAYVIAHELGHHVQHLLGIDGQVREAQERNPSAANDLSVRLELQADCFAGVWGHSTDQRQILEKGDVEEALNAASAIGDDRIQQQSGMSVNPETWTHGSSEQRVYWFRRGLEGGNINQCNTFEGNRV